MRTATRVLGFAGALALVAGTSAAQNGNDAPYNNAADFYTTFSSPSAGASIGTNPPDITGDLYWRAFAGADYMNDVDGTGLGGSVMEIAGYFESLLDEDWSDSANFLDRLHSHATIGVSGALEPDFFTTGITGTEVLVSIGPSGFSDPCTIYTTFCSPAGSSCAPGGGAWSWVVDIPFTATPGSGVVMAADGSLGSDMATTYFIQGGHVSSGGPCGIGTNETNALISTDESQGDITGLGINSVEGFQVAGSGPIAWGVATGMEAMVQFRGNVMNMIGDSGTGLGPEVGDNGGGGTNGMFLSVGSGVATLGCELRDANHDPFNVGIAGASLVPLPNPGLPALGGNLLVLPDGLFGSTSGVWVGTVVIDNPWFTTEGRFIGAQLPVPTTAAGATLYTQGATFSLTTFTADTTNVATTHLLP